MIYNIKIGTRDNCYIITGGLDGISTFEPVEVDGTQNSAVIHIDSESDDIFTPWIKQSLEVQFLKYNDGDFDDIIAGNDNQTFGILIEDGALELVSGDLRITSGGKLKFIGTLTLETYTEQYKHISPISFIFHDRIGSLEDYDFSTNVQYKNVCDIIACCVFPVVCSDKLYLEWPYTLSGSNDPKEFLLELSDMDEKTNKEVLETLLKDFGLQMVVDYSKNVQTNLKDSGAIVIRSVIEHAEIINTFWELNLTSFIASTCQRQYYTYTGDSTVTIQKTMQLCNSAAWPLIDNDTTLNLERVASEILAKSEIDKNANVIFRGDYDEKYNNSVTYPPVFPIYPDGYTRDEYCPLIYIADDPPPSDPGGVEDLFPHIDDLIRGVKDKSDFMSPYIVRFYDREEWTGIGLRETKTSFPNPDYMAITSLPIPLAYSQFTSNKIKFNISISYNGFKEVAIPADFGTIHCNIIMLKNNSLYIYDGSSWISFTSQSQLISYNSSDVIFNSPKDFNYDFEIDSTNSVVIMAVLIMGPSSTLTYGHAIIKKIKISPVSKISDYTPNSIALTTNLSGNNRKKIELDTTFINSPNIKTAGYLIKNVISNINKEYPYMTNYKGINQTMLAHLSDQYGWQYDGNRWNMDATVKGYLSVIDLMGIFRLDDKNMMLLNGDYDARYREIKGTWGQVLEIEENKYRLLDDNFIPLEWDNGNIINLN